MGVWSGSPTWTGRWGAGGATAVSANVSATATTNQFDTTMDADTGDLWRRAVDVTGSFSPLVLDPGRTGTITLTITPAGTSGTTVAGFVGVDTLDPKTVSGDTLIAFPYAYRIQ